MYTPTIGLEIHAELKTKSKMFCGCANDPHNVLPNIHVCPVCMGHPGTLPVVNQEAVRKTLAFGKAIGAKLADYSEFDRKNYFYPDIPKAYQLSQYAFPFVTGGEVLGITLTRAHLEEDTARSQHEGHEGSLVNYNRAGVPLLELVTEPVIRDAETAVAFAKELQLIFRTLDIADAHMEQGGMRVEANISVSKTEEFGTKVEVKNLNSFKSVQLAIEYEIERQIALLENGEEVRQETRGWDEVRLKTFSQRSKETAKDYRYFPDPDIPKMRISEQSSFSADELNDIVKTLPQEKREKYTLLGLTRDKIEVIIADTFLDSLFSETIEYRKSDEASKKFITLLANYLTSDTVSLLQEKGYPATVNSKQLASLIHLIQDSKINSRTAKDLLPEVLFVGHDPEKVANERGLLQSNNEDDVLVYVKEVISNNPSVVKEYLDGKDAAIQFLVGQGMKLSKGAANPAMLRDLLQKEINNL